MCIRDSFTAPIDIIAFARLASIFSNTGSPSPTGRPVMTHSHTPPEELKMCIRDSIDTASGKDIVYCDKPNCTHEGYSRTNQNPSCPAAF